MLGSRFAVIGISILVSLLATTSSAWLPEQFLSKSESNEVRVVQQVVQSYRPERRQFALLLAMIRRDASTQEVEALLGEPDDIWRAPDPVPYPTDEIWCYGSLEHLSLPTLGQVCFREGRMVWVSGKYELPPLPNIITEEELCAGMRFLHPGPEHSGYNDPLHLIRVVNYLQPLGKSKALAIIDEYARISGIVTDHTWFFLLLRTLFDVPDPPGHMPHMYIGAMSPEPPVNHSLIPRFPIVITGDIPFSLLWGVSLGGMPEPVRNHVEYFQQHGSMRPNKLRPPDDPYPSFKKLLASNEWAEMAKNNDTPRWLVEYEGHTLLQVLALARTAYDPPEARQPFAYPKPADYERHHRSFLETGARWDERLQMYVRKDGTHGIVGHLGSR